MVDGVASGLGVASGVADLTIALVSVDVPGLGAAHVRVVAPALPGSSPDAVGFRP